MCDGAFVGAIISEYLAYQDDYTAPESDETVTRLSSRPNVVMSLWQPWRTNEIIIFLMDAGEAPVVFYSNALRQDKIHQLWAADPVHKKAQEFAIPTLMYSGSRNELPEEAAGTSWLELSVQFCKECFNHIRSVDAQ